MSRKKGNRRRALQAFSRIKHRMEGATAFARGHRHLFSNVTDVVLRSPGTHRHVFRGFTSTVDGHRHRYMGITGPSIDGTGPFGGGPRHFHRFRMVTSVTNGHRHITRGTTTRNRFIRNSTPTSP